MFANKSRFAQILWDSPAIVGRSEGSFRDCAWRDDIRYIPSPDAR